MLGLTTRTVRKSVVSGIILSLLLLANFPAVLSVNPAKMSALSSNGTTQADPVDWWPMFHHDLNHTGTSTSTAPTNNTLWTYKTGNGVSSSPAVVGGLAYAGSWDHNVYCLNDATGSLVWNYTTGSWMNSSPAVVSGLVYVGSGDEKVYCLNATTGAFVWSYKTGGWVESSPAVADGRVYVGSDDNSTYCLNAATGKLVWSYKTGYYVFSSPAVVGGLVYVGSLDAKVYCLNAATGALVWNYTIGSSVVSSPVVAGNLVYLGSFNDSKVYCLNATTGAFVWSYKTGGWVESSPAVADGRVYVGSDDKNVYCLNAATGAPVWNRTTGGSVDESSPAVAGGRVYVGSDDKNVYCLNDGNGWLVWNYTTGGQVESSPAVVDGVVYVGSEDGRIYAFGLRARGPSMDNLIIKYYSNSSACAAALQNGRVDLTDLASSSAQMDVVSPGNSLFEFDFNNNATLPSYSNISYSYLNNPTYYKGFRQGVACLVNKDYIVNHMVNYSSRVDTPILPWGTWWIDWSVCQYDSYGNLLGNYPYNFNSTLANQYFNQAGFIQGTTPNPYYDPSFPSSAQYLRIHPQTNATMPPVIFYIRNDDPYRLEIGRMLRDNLRKMGVPVDAIEANLATCVQYVGNLKDYQIYTGGWSNTDAFSLLYVYSSNPQISEGYDYVQFKNATYEQYVEKVWHATSLSDAKNAALECQEILVQECACVWLYSPNSIMGYNNLSGVVDFRGGRIDNKWTLLAARPSEGSASRTITYGLKKPPSSLNVITDYSGAFPLDSYNGENPVDDCLNQIYNTLLSYSPVDKTPGNTYGQGDRGGTMPWMAEDWQIGNWSSPYEPGENLTELTFYLRDNIKWQDGVELNSTDVKFTIDYLKALGNVTSLSSNVADVYSVITPDAHTVIVYENVSNIWTLDLIGTLPILPKHIFQNITDVSGYTPGANQGTSANKALIGSGPWEYVFNNASMLILRANADYFMETPPPTEVDFRYNWEMGSWVVDTMDATMVGEAFNSTGQPMPSAKWEPRADVNGNGVIDSTDVGYVAGTAQCFNVTWGSSGQYTPPQPSTNCTMYVDTSNSQILEGENFTAYVKATNVNKLSGYQFQLQYDESSLNCLNITLSPPFNLPGVKIWNETTGLIMGGATLLGSTPPVSNSTLTLATIKFNAKSGGGSTLHLLDTELAQYGAPLLACQLIPHRTIDKGIIVGVPTPTGTNVAVSPSSNAQVTFTKTTTTGITTLNVTQPPSTVLAPVGNSVFCDIKTTATYVGNITLQFAYNPTGLTLEDKKAMKIWLWNATPNKYVDITTSVDTVNNIVYGVSPHLSMFAITCTLSLTDNNNQQIQTTVQTPTSPPTLPDGRAALAYYNIQTTQQYTPPVNIRLVYNASTISAEEAPFLQMWLWNATSNKWVDITTRVDTVNNIVSGVSPHLSMFAITCLQPFPQGIVTLGATCSKTIVARGDTLNINIPIQNQGGLSQSFKVYVYANSTIIYTQQISNLPVLGLTSITFTLDTTSLAYGNYSISACDQPINWIKVTIPPAVWPAGGLVGITGYKLVFTETMNNTLGSPAAIDYYWSFSIDKWNGAQWVAAGISGSSATVVGYVIPSLTTLDLPYYVYVLPLSGSNAVGWGDWLRINYTFHWTYSSTNYEVDYVAKLNVHPGDIGGSATVTWPYFASDGYTDIKDISVITSHWHQFLPPLGNPYPGSTYPIDGPNSDPGAMLRRADINNDGYVDIRDLSLVTIHWHQQWTNTPPPG